MRRPTCEDGGERLHGVKRALQPSRLQASGEQLENAILEDETEDSVTPGKDPNPKALQERFLMRASCLPAAGDFDEGAAGVEGSRPAGVDMRAVVVVDDPDEVSALQLGQRQQRKKENKKQKKERDTRRDRTGGPREACVPRSCDESPTTFCGSTYICIFPCQFAHFHSVPGCRPVNLMRGEKRRERITAYKRSGAAWKSRWMAGIVKPSASALSLLGPVVKST